VGRSETNSRHPIPEKVRPRAVGLFEPTTPVVDELRYESTFGQDVVVGKGVTDAGGSSLIGTIPFGYVVAPLPSSIAAGQNLGLASSLDGRVAHRECEDWNGVEAQWVKAYVPESAWGPAGDLYIQGARGWNCFERFGGTYLYMHTVYGQ
jgi:hypothetical protein